MLNAVLLIIAIVIFGLLTVLSVVFSVIFFANSKKGKFGWLGGFFFCLTGLIVAVFLLVNTVVHKVSSLARGMEQTFSNSLNANQADSAEYKAYLIADSISNKQIDYLISIERETAKDKVPNQFYRYLGFKDYYRLPLRYPFSLHCIDSLGNATLFNEIAVNKFDENNNGEKNCEVTNVSDFVFDEKILISKITKNNKEKSSYIIYYFDNDKIEEIENINKFNLRIKNLKFSKSIEFISCKEYFGAFSL